MKLIFSPNASRQIKKLTLIIRKKLYKQTSLLLTNPRHPSLRSKKMSGEDKFEARVDFHYRFTYKIENEEIWILSVGPHDEGLGKK